LSEVLVNTYRFPVPVPYVAECWWVADMNASSITYDGAPVNQVMSSQATTVNNPMVDWESPNVRQVGMYLCTNAGLSDGLFRLGVWDSSGNPKVVSDQFTVADLTVGLTGSETEFIKSLASTTTIDNGDCVGIIVNDPPTGTGNVSIGTAVISPQTDWARHIFIQGSTGSYATNKPILCCLTT